MGAKSKHGIHLCFLYTFCIACGELCVLFSVTLHTQGSGAGRFTCVNVSALQKFRTLKCFWVLHFQIGDA